MEDNIIYLISYSVYHDGHWYSPFYYDSDTTDGIVLPDYLEFTSGTNEIIKDEEGNIASFTVKVTVKADSNQDTDIDLVVDSNQDTDTDLAVTGGTIVKTIIILVAIVLILLITKRLLNRK